MESSKYIFKWNFQNFQESYFQKKKEKEKLRTSGQLSVIIDDLYTECHEMITFFFFFNSNSLLSRLSYALKTFWYTIFTKFEGLMSFTKFSALCTLNQLDFSYSVTSPCHNFTNHITLLNWIPNIRYITPKRFLTI